MVSQRLTTKDTQRRLEGIVASAMDAIITIDEDQHIVLFNPAAERMFRISSEKVLGQCISCLLPSRFRSDHEQHIRTFRETGTTNRRMGALGSISGLRADGEEFPVEASISQVMLHGERLATVILRDITERVANERVRNTLAREVDHRAKNALAVVQAVVSLTTAPTKEAFVDAVRMRVAAMGRAHSLLAENRWSGGDLQEILREEITAFADEGQVVIEGMTVALVANAVQPISLLVHELATNATKYGGLSTPAGRLHIRCDLLDSGDMLIHWTEKGCELDGPPPVSGFGLILMDTVIRQVRGGIARNWGTDGLCICVTLPSSAYRLAGEARSKRAAEGEEGIMASGQRGGNILLVEDELLVGMEMAQALEEEGWNVLGPLGSVTEALEVLRERGLPLVAVLDINLNGETAYPVAEHLQREGVPFLFCTGYGSGADDERYRNVPVVKKPFTRNRLFGVLDSLVNAI